MNCLKTHITRKLVSFWIFAGLAVMTGHPLLHAIEDVVYPDKDLFSHEQPFEDQTRFPVEECLECVLSALSAFESVFDSSPLFLSAKTSLKPGSRDFSDQHPETGFSLRAPPLAYV